MTVAVLLIAETDIIDKHIIHTVPELSSYFLHSFGYWVEVHFSEMSHNPPSVLVKTSCNMTDTG